MAASVWGVELEDSGDACAKGALSFTMSGPGWRTQTDIRICDWSDTIAAYGRFGAMRRIARGLSALFDFAVSGTVWRYFRTSWRYGVFYLYPLILFAFALLAGGVVAAAPLNGSRGRFLWSVPLALAIVAASGVFAVRRLHILTLMDDWAFARDLAHGTNPAIAAKIAEQASAIEVAFGDDDCDETVVAGHSLGVSLCALALAEALGRARPARPVHVLSVGSSLLKTALHPAARDQRRAVRALTEENRLLWVDVQSLSDPMNFYRSNPATSLGITGGRVPVVKRISLGRIVGDKTRRAIKRDLFRRHRQFVYGAERRHPYAFHMMLLGPVGLERFAAAGSVDIEPLVAAGPNGIPSEVPA